MIIEWNGKRPKIHKTCFIAPSAQIIGDVEIGERSSVWMNAVIRGDHEPLRIGKRSNVQDNCTVHASKGIPVKIGDYVTVGHRAIIHSCFIEDCSLIGMGAIVLDRVKVGKHCLIGAGAVVTKDVPPKSLVLGMPGKVVRKLDSKEIKELKEDAMKYVRLTKTYLKK